MLLPLISSSTPIIDKVSVILNVAWVSLGTLPGPNRFPTTLSVTGLGCVLLRVDLSGQQGFDMLLGLSLAPYEMCESSDNLVRS